jgi:hypothetical protein
MMKVEKKDLETSNTENTTLSAIFGSYSNTNPDTGSAAIKRIGVQGYSFLNHADARTTTVGVYGYAFNSSGSAYAGYFNGATHIVGALSKGSGTFTIRHPDPAKSGSMALQHSFVESPTRGDNIYTYVVSSSADNQTVVTDLPSYWEFLNENPRMWIQARGKFAQAYGEVSSSLKQFSTTMEKSGSYDVMIIGTRKDKDAQAFKGVEVSIGQTGIVCAEE